MLLDRNDRRGTALAMLLFAGCAVVPPACFFVYFLSQMPAADALRGTAGAWVFAVGSGIERSPFYRHGMGLDRPVGNLVRMLASFAGFTIFIAAAAIVTRTATGSRSRSILRRVQQVTLLVAAIGLAQTGLAFVALPLIVMSVLVTSGALFMRARRAPADRGLALRFLMIAIWSAFALVLLAKMGLNPRLVQYGFYLALPAVVSMVIAIAWLIPELIERWSAHGAGPTVRTMAVCAFAGAMVPYLADRLVAIRSEDIAGRVGPGSPVGHSESPGLAGSSSGRGARRPGDGTWRVAGGAARGGDAELPGSTAVSVAGGQPDATRDDGLW